MSNSWKKNANTAGRLYRDEIPKTWVLCSGGKKYQFTQ